MKYLLFILSLMFAASATSFAKEDFIFFYDFNAEEAGKPPSKPWKPTAAGEIVVDNFPSADNKSVKITDTGDGGSTFIMYFDDIALYEGTTRPAPVEPASKLTTTWGMIKRITNYELQVTN